MARPLRLEHPGAIWHVTSRGNNRGDIFLDDDDRIMFLAILGETVRRFGWVIHYTLMTNHFRLVFATPEPTLSRGSCFFCSRRPQAARRVLTSHLPRKNVFTGDSGARSARCKKSSAS